MTRTRPIAAAALASLMYGLVGVTHAQQSDHLAPSQAKCDSLTRGLDKWKERESWDVLDRCGASGVDALVHATRISATLPDAEGFSHLLGAVGRVRDTRISDAAIQVALAQDAATAARVFAVLAALGQHAPRLEVNLRVPFTELLSGRESTGCPILLGHGERQPPLDDPSGRARLRAALRTLAAEGSAASGLRQLAKCALSHLRVE